MALAIRDFDAVIIGPGSFFTSLMPILLVRGVSDELNQIRGPIIVVSNILTEGRGMAGFSAGEAVRRIAEAVGRPVDVLVANDGQPEGQALEQYAAEHKEPLPIDDVPKGCEVITGNFWQGTIARHARRPLAYTVWSVLAARLLR